MYKVRFHLAKGKNYLKWQIRSDDGVIYYDPSMVSIIMKNCVLKNNMTVALKIHSGATKRTCAWVECQEFEIVPHIHDFDGIRVFYNPKVAPYWVCNNANYDNIEFDILISIGNKIYVENKI